MHMMNEFIITCDKKMKIREIFRVNNKRKNPSRVSACVRVHSRLNERNKKIYKEDNKLTFHRYFLIKCKMAGKK